MKQYIKNNIIKDANRIVVIKDGMQIINPSEELILEDGWIEYIPEEPEPIEPEPILEPSSYAVNNAVMLMMLPQAKEQFNSLSDIEALKVKELADTWHSKIGGSVEIGERLYYNDKLYKVIQPVNPVLEHQTPDLVPACYALIEGEHAGTKEDPIPYEQMMLIEKDKYYTQYGKLYIGMMNANTGFPYDLKDLSTLVQEVIE